MNIALCILRGNDEYYSVFHSSETITVGSRQTDDIYIPNFRLSFTFKWLGGQQALLSIVSEEGARTISATNNIPVDIDIDAGVTALFSIADERPFFLPLDASEIFVGRSQRQFDDGCSNAVIIKLPFIGRKHFKIENKNGKYVVTDLNSSNGLYLNGRRITTAVLKDHDTLSIYTVQMLFDGGILRIFNAGSYLSVNKSRHTPLNKKEAKMSNTTDRDIHVRAPRLISGFETTTVDMEKMPETGGKPQFNWLSILVSPMVSIALMVVLVVALGVSPIMLIMSGVMSVLSAIIAVLTYRKQKNQHSLKEALIGKKYREYLSSVSDRVDRAHEQQMETLTAANPAPYECLDIAEKRSRTLWERKPGDDDFVSARIGTGVIPAAFQAKLQKSQVVLHEQELEIEASRIADSSSTIQGAPIVCNFRTYAHTGIIGERTAELRLARNILVELATTHSYDELKIIVVFPEEERTEWEWVRWLPHCSDFDGKNRYFFCTHEDAEPALEEISEMLSRRNAAHDSLADNKQEDIIPHYFFVFAKYPWVERQSIKKLLFSGENLGCSTLFVYDQLSVLPKECSQIIELSGSGGELFDRSSSLNRVRFSIDALTVFQADRFARALAPLYANTGEGMGRLPNTVSFLNGYHVSRPEQLHIEKRWSGAKTYQTLSVPIASRGGGDNFEFDIHEKHHGVNGIVAGMPGSGKTEMVQSWLLSLAINYSPQDLSFVLIDFKGTGMIAPFRNIPHLAGAISNLDTNIDRNLQAIQSEVHRRETIIDKYSGHSIKNVNDLNKAFAKGLVPEKLPILLIVIDEFAEFKKVFPEFGAEIDSLTSKGRALGMFVILMTQKPAGVVSAKSEDNIKFRWCLRVANYGASREMIGRPDAATITIPGRCFIKVGEDEVFEEVQSFWSGAPYQPPDAIEKKAFVPISVIERNGTRTPCERIEQEATSETYSTEIDIIVQYIIDFCKAHHIPNANQVWTPRLPDHVILTDIMENAFDGHQWPAKEYLPPIVGIIDEPASQQQYPMSLDFSKLGNTLVYGAPVTGKTTFLQTLVMSLTMRRKPDEANIYIMDFGGWNMSVFRDFPHVGGIVNEDTPERLKELMLLLNDTLRSRKAIFSKAGVGSISAYRQTAGKPLPDVFLVVDNLSVLLKMYAEADSFFANLAGSGANYGIYLIATAQAANSVPMRISQNIKNTLALQMIDKSDYSYLVGKTNHQLPQIPGRGLAKGNPPLEFQIALPGPGKDEKAITDFIRNTGMAMDTAWSGSRAELIPEMPDTIPFGSLRTEKAALGLTTDRIQPVEYDWETQHFLLISGTPQSGKSNLLYAITAQLKERLGGRICLFDVKSSAPESMLRLADDCLSQGKQIDNFVESIRPELQKRQSEKRENRVARFEPLILAIDDYSDFFTAVSNDTIARVLAIVKIGCGLDIYLIIAGSAYEISALFNKGEAVLLSLGKSKQALMLGGCINDHGAVPTNAVYGMKSVKVGASEGYFVHDSEPTRFKAICFTKEA